MSLHPESFINQHLLFLLNKLRVKAKQAFRQIERTHGNCSNIHRCMPLIRCSIWITLASSLPRRGDSQEQPQQDCGTGWAPEKLMLSSTLTSCYRVTTLTTLMIWFDLAAQQNLWATRENGAIITMLTHKPEHLLKSQKSDCQVAAILNLNLLSQLDKTLIQHSLATFTGGARILQMYSK